MSKNARFYKCPKRKWSLIKFLKIALLRQSFSLVPLGPFLSITLHKRYYRKLALKKIMWYVLGMNDSGNFRKVFLFCQLIFCQFFANYSTVDLFCFYELSDGFLGCVLAAHPHRSIFYHCCCFSVTLSHCHTYILQNQGKTSYLWRHPCIVKQSLLSGSL